MNCTKRKRWDSKRIPDLLRGLFDVSLERLAGFAIAAYFSGWNYLDAYFSHFNVNSWTYAFNDYTIFLYSFFVLVKVRDVLWQSLQDWMINAPGLVILALIVSCLLLAVNLTEKRQKYDALKNFVGKLATAIAGLGCLYVFSIEAGRISAREVSQDLDTRRIILTLAEGFEKQLDTWYTARGKENHAEHLLAELDAAGEDKRLGLIWRSNSETLVLLTNEAGEPETTYRIPNQFVTLIDAKMEKEQP